MSAGLASRNSTIANKGKRGHPKVTGIKAGGRGEPLPYKEKNRKAA